MAIKFCKIFKNGTKFLENLSQHLSCDQDISIVVIREPYERFWSTTKFFHPKFTSELYSSTEECHQYIDDTIHFICKNPDQMSPYSKNFFYHSVYYQKLIEDHFRSQDSFIKDSKFDYVFKIENVSDELSALINSGIIKTDKPIDQFGPINATRKIDDDNNIQYIINNHSNTLRSLYANDFYYYENPSVLKR